MADSRQRQQNTQPRRMYGTARMSGVGARFEHPTRRRRRPSPRLPVILAAAVVVIAAAVAVFVLLGDRPPKDQAVFAEATQGPTQDVALAALLQPSPSPAGGAETDAAEPFADEAPDGGAEGQETAPDDGYAADEVVGLRPTAAPGGYLPIFSKAKTEEKIIAITVDDCNQTSNLDKIVDCAVENGGKLTIFPIGKNLAREGLQEVVRKAHDLGMEFENHSYSHSAFYKLSAEKMAEEIFNQNRALSYVLGVNYQMHFLRTRGGDNRRDLRTHQYIDKLGYYGMSHWTMSGSTVSMKKLKATLEPGNIYLFHTTDNDLTKLLEFIPYAAAQGYRLVTLNEMFGYPANEETEITTPIQEIEIPAPDPYVYEYKDLKARDYLWDVYLLQQRLHDLGWLKSGPDGEYGKGTYMAVGYFQRAVGLKVDGKASPETQEAIFADGAPTSSDGKTPISSPAPTLDPDAPAPTTAPRAVPSPGAVDMTIFD